MTLQEFEQLFEGKTQEEILSCLEFIRLWHEMTPEKRKAIDELLTACEKGLTMSEAINSISDATIRERMIQTAMEQGIYDMTLKEHMA